MVTGEDNVEKVEDLRDFPQIIRLAARWFYAGGWLSNVPRSAQKRRVIL